MYQHFEYQAVIDLIHSTRPLVMDRHKAGDITQKGRSDFATAVDYEVQTYLQEKLCQLYPHIQFFAEENHMQNVDPARPYWILDPIDGTTNLIHDCHQSCVALALWDGEKLVFGCCYNPFRDETFAAELGKGAYLNGRPIHVSDMSEMEKALVIVGTSPYEREKTDRVFDMVKRIFQRSADIRRLGSAELDLCWVACGRADCYVEYNLKPWDYAAGTLIAQEAGATATRLDGGPMAPLHAGSVFITNGVCHSVLSELQQ